MLPTTMKALVTQGNGAFEIQDVPLPALGPAHILVKVVAAAQNPTDWKSLLWNKQKGNIMGCDYSGTVVAVGTAVPPGVRYVGERVAGAVHGGIEANGSFAEYLRADATIVIHLPDDMTFENAAQLGTSILTTCQVLYQCFNLPTPLQPTSTPKDILIWSGTSATGQFAIQFAKLAGLRVVSTSSPKNVDFVKSLGADEVFDYADSTAFMDICQTTKGSLTCAMDCISEGTTPFQVSMSLNKDGGTIATLLPYQSRKKGVNTVFILAYTALGKDIEFPMPFPANREHYENAQQYCVLVSQILATLPIKTVPVRRYPHGLASVEQGFQHMRDRKIHAEKITYLIADTPGL